MDEWNRRENDGKFRKELLERIDKLEGKVEDGLEKLGDEYERLKETVVGGLSGEDGLKLRLARIETDFNQLRAIVGALERIIHGDVLGRNSLAELSKSALATAEDAKRIAEGKVQIKTTHRGQNIILIVGVLSLAGALTTTAINHWDKIFRRETPTQQVRRIEKEIEELKKTRGPEVRKKLRELEKRRRELSQ